jgi:hypothetical protein
MGARGKKLIRGLVATVGSVGVKGGEERKELELEV